MQLDIFSDSAETALLNDVTNSIERLSYHDAECAMARLLAANPGNPSLSDANTLLTVRDYPKSIDNHEQLQTLVDFSEKTIAPAARRLFGERASRWINQNIWMSLSVASSGLRYSDSFPAVHSAAILIRAQQWSAAVSAVKQIPCWRSMPVPLQWMVTATVKARGLDEAWPFLLELAWMEPLSFASTVTNLNDPVLSRLTKEFDASFDDNADDQLTWFPALAITVEPSLLPMVRDARPAKTTDATTSFDCVCTLLSLEKQGRQAKISVERARLRALNCDLYSRYMKTR